MTMRASDSTVRIKKGNHEIPSQDWYVTQDDRFALTGCGVFPFSFPVYLKS